MKKTSRSRLLPSYATLEQMMFFELCCFLPFSPCAKEKGVFFGLGLGFLFKFKMKIKRDRQAIHNRQNNRIPHRTNCIKPT